MSAEKRTKLVIGDIGSTKGAWTGVTDNRQLRLLTEGYNPHAHPDAVLSAILNRLVETYGEMDELIYYGTGISDDVVAAEIAEQISRSAQITNVAVYSDLLGAARACLGNQAGVVAILGTGSNACRYDGTEVTALTPSLGYPLGDEGSGWRMGSTLIREFYYGRMPHELQPEFKQLLPDTRRELLGYLKGSPQPNRYLASFATFAGVHKEHPWISDTIRDCLDAFIVSHLQPLTSDEPVYFAGSIAGTFIDILEELLNEYGLSIGGVVSDPLKVLVKYHTNQ
jgi:N-acetylglucosamine kinase-like BadF-type ATPase